MKDSIFVKYIFIAILSFLIDIVLFKLFNTIFFNAIIIPTIMARIISSIFNFTMNKNRVFKSNKKTKDTIIKYFILVIITMFSSGIIVKLLHNFIKIDPVFIKIPVEFLIFIVNYLIQKLYIFKNS